MCYGCLGLTVPTNNLPASHLLKNTKPENPREPQMQAVNYGGDWNYLVIPRGCHQQITLGAEVEARDGVSWVRQDLHSQPNTMNLQTCCTRTHTRAAQIVPWKSSHLERLVRVSVCWETEIRHLSLRLWPCNRKQHKQTSQSESAAKLGN
jgi:hypothetical protein